MDQASYWTQENVVPHLLGGASIVPVASLRERIAVWLSQQGTVRVVTDYPEYDFTFLKRVLAPRVETLHPHAFKFGTSAIGELHRPFLEQVRNSFHTIGKPADNGLMDAYALRAMWDLATELDPSLANSL